MRKHTHALGEIDGTGATFGGVSAGSGLTVANAFVIEDKISDFLDIGVTGSDTVGFVRLKSKNVFVTQNSNSIQRAIDADVEWLKAHPSRKSIAASRQAKKATEHDQ